MNRAGSKNLFKCELCKKQLPWKSLQNHMNYHAKEGGTECDKCGQYFNSLDKLARHKAIRHSGQYFCNLCQKGFKTKTGLINHTNSHYDESLHCSICKVRFTRKPFLLAHMKMHWEKQMKDSFEKVKMENGISIKDPERTDESPVDATSIKNNRDEFKCAVCGQGFTNGKQVICHLALHTGEKKFECEMCPATFRKKSNLEAHSELHASNQVIGCEVCQRNFLCYYGLYEHMTQHTGERPFKCDMCSFVSRHKASLKNHLRNHIQGSWEERKKMVSKRMKENRSVRVFREMLVQDFVNRCEICGKKFEKLYWYVMHKKQHEEKDIR